MSPLHDHLADCQSLGAARTLSRSMLPRAIRDARKAGATLGQLSLASGLTKQRVSQICKEES